MDAFYAAVEILDDPALAGKPVIVGGSRVRGVVSSASYEARASGVRSAMPTAQAARLCPAGIFVPPRMERYVEVSRSIMRVFRSFTPLVEPLSLDEAFLDMAGTERLHGSVMEAGRKVKARIREGTGLTASVGVSYCKFVAKLASDLEKPDGFTVIPHADVGRILAPLPVGRLWGVGPKTQARLEGLGLRTIADIREAGERRLVDRLGDLGLHILRLAQGEDDRRVEPAWEARSIGAERTFERDLSATAAMDKELLSLAEDVGTRLRDDASAARTVSVKVRFHDFRTVTRSLTLDCPTDITRELYETACALLRRAWSRGARVRLLGIQAQNLVPAGTGQLTLFDAAGRDRDRRLDSAIDAVRQKLGPDAIVRARSLEGESIRDTGSAGREQRNARRP
ncbi:MAG: DNA polymerase IV [Candidatus Brocadiae bacterium]|nr:DNA polymerase IV [Candidatus Brocadiia bacterium]